MTQRILGIDPGLRVTGYGAIEYAGGRARMIEAGIVAPRNGASLESRLRELYDGISQVVAATRPHVIVIEELYTTYRNPLTAILMGHARGVLCLAGAQAAVPVKTLAHSMVKRALVGSGTSKKDQVSRMVVQLLDIRRPLKPPDVSDALAIALAYGNVALHERNFSKALRKPRLR